jgi:hypothetical protein
MKTLEDVLEEIAPQPDPEFVADMERRMQELTAEPGGTRRRRFKLPDLRPRAVAAVAASAMLALLVGVSVLGAGEEAADPDTPVAMEESAGRSLAAPTGDAAGGAAGGAEFDTEIAPSPPIPPADSRVAPGEQARRVERSAQLTLADDPSEFDRLADAIFRTADRRNGFVLRSSFTQGEAGPSGGFFELRVPGDELQATLNELSRLATVRARSESGTDVTAAFVSLRDRLRMAQAERKSLLRRLERAETDRAAAAIRRRLEIVGNKLTALRQQFLAARERTEFATVNVELVDEDNGAAGASETDEALDDAVGSLEDILNFLIRAGAILIPVVITALLVWLGAAIARRRARDRTLA